MSRTRHHGNKAKQRAFGDGWLWLQATPGWWVRVMMTRPQRRLASVWQRKAETSTDLELVGDPPSGRKPHHYFW
jgi:superoxide dismutase